MTAIFGSREASEKRPLQNESAETISPEFRVPIARHAMLLMVSRTNWTWPSANRTFTPPA